MVITLSRLRRGGKHCRQKMRRLKQRLRPLCLCVIDSGGGVAIRIGVRVLPCRARSRAARAQHGPMYPYCRALKLLLHRRLMMTPELPTIALAAMSGGVPKGIYIHNLFWGFHPRFFEGEDKLLGDSVGGEFFSSSSSSSSCSKNVT